MLSEHKDTILENFLSSAIRTLNTDEIYNILIDSLILMLNPQGLLLTQNLNTRRSFYTVRRWGDIFFEKDYSVPSDAFLGLPRLRYTVILPSLISRINTLTNSGSNCVPLFFFSSLTA